jgi:uncharacterized RDD family membrane protein YckC
MSSGFAGVRCIRCGAYTEGAQVCGGCTERQQADEAARTERVAQANRRAPGKCGVCCIGWGPVLPVADSPAPAPSSAASAANELRALAPGEGELAFAGSWIRFLAALIDGAILFVVNVVLASLIPNPVTAFFAQLFLNATYTIGFWIGQGATPGKMAVGVKVVMANGLPIEFGATCLRYVGYLACALTLGIGYLMIAFTAEKRGLHDNIGGTVVIKSR